MNCIKRNKAKQSKTKYFNLTAKINLEKTGHNPRDSNQTLKHIHVIKSITKEKFDTTILFIQKNYVFNLHYLSFLPNQSFFMPNQLGNL